MSWHLPTVPPNERLGMKSYIKALTSLAPVVGVVPKCWECKTSARPATFERERALALVCRLRNLVEVPDLPYNRRKHRSPEPF